MDGRLRTLAGKVRPLLRAYGGANIGLYSASGAYYLFFSLGPLLVLLLGLLPHLPFSQEDLQQALLGLLDYAPQPIQELIQDLVAGVYAGSSAALGIGIVVELWSAGRFLSQVMRGISQIYDGRVYGNFLRNRLLGALYTAALLALILGNVVLLFAGKRLIHVTRFWSAVMHLRGVTFFFVVTIINGLLFSTVPHKKLRFLRQLPGAAFATAAWLAFSRIYSWAVARFGFYSIYGTVAIVIISLFWVYCSLFLLFLGAWFNALREQAESEPDAGEVETRPLPTEAE